MPVQHVLFLLQLTCRRCCCGCHRCCSSCCRYCSQVTPLDRKWSNSPNAPDRLPNLVVPYPSSLLGADVPRGRAAPWALPSLRKPVLAFAAFGMISNLSNAALPQLRDSFAQHCATTERAMIAQSACYGKRCRFALRALLMWQLDTARLPPKERHRERSCLVRCHPQSIRHSISRRARPLHTTPRCMPHCIPHSAYTWPPQCNSGASDVEFGLFCMAS